MGFAEELRKLAVWQKGAEVPPLDPAEWRQDEYGSLIRYHDHGDRSSPYGWEIDHKLPAALGGIDGFGYANLRPLHHRINSGLGGLLGAHLSAR